MLNLGPAAANYKYHYFTALVKWISDAEYVPGQMRKAVGRRAPRGDYMRVGGTHETL